ncbi:MAG: LD-carboxypeptidase [Bacteroides sp.]
MDNFIFPSYLQEGDKVAIVSPSGKIDKNLLKGAQERLASWGLQSILGKHAAAASGKYAGNINQRLDDFQHAMDAPDVKAIFCSRGGYGAVHIIEQLQFEQFCKSPKWLIGFSDITALHNLFQYHGFASIHAPMARHLSVEPEDNAGTLSLRNTLLGQLPTYNCAPHKLNKTGEAKGIIKGGNLAVFYGLRGTKYDIIPENTILYIEDVGERPHAIERMMYNLKLGGILERLSGLIIGQFTEYDEDLSLGKPLYEAIVDIVKEYKYPVCFDFPVGHVAQNMAIVNGAQVELTVTSKVVELKF